MEALVAVAAIAAAIGSIIGVIAYAPQLIAAARWLWLHTFGRRQAWYQRLGRLSAGVQLDYFMERLGLKVAFRQQHLALETHTFVHPWFYVLALTDETGKVLLYAVTTRDRKFKPPIWPHTLHPQNHPRPGNPRLGTFVFSQDLGGVPGGVSGDVGANRFGYVEGYYFGNPGNYQTYLVGLNDAGYMTREATQNLLKAMPKYSVALGDFHRTESGDFLQKLNVFDSIDEYLKDRGVRQFREAAMPNSYGITAPHFGMGSDGFPKWLGVDHGLVRTLLE